MEVNQAPTQPVDVVEPMVIDKQPEQHTEVHVGEGEDNNHVDPVDAVKTHEPKSVPQVTAEESRPADVAVTPKTESARDTSVAVADPPATPKANHPPEASSEVVTPAGTVEAPCAADAPSTEVVNQDVPVKTVSESEASATAVESEPTKVEHNVEHKVESVAEHKTEQRVESTIEHNVEHKVDPPVENKVGPTVEPSSEHKVDQHDAVAASATLSPTVNEDTTAKPESTHTTPATTKEEPKPTEASAPSPGKKAKNEKKQANSDSFATEEVLNEVQNFLTLQVVENRCSSHTQEIHEFMEKHLNEKQRKRYVAVLVERIMQHFTKEAAAKGEEISVDIQSNICLIEQMFLTLGRRSPLEDMYTAEEEEMLDLLFHSNSSDNLPING